MCALDSHLRLWLPPHLLRVAPLSWRPSNLSFEATFLYDLRPLPETQRAEALVMVPLTLRNLKDHHSFSVATDRVLQVVSQLRISVRDMRGLLLQSKDNIAQSCQWLINILSLFNSDPSSFGFQNSFRPSEVNKRELALNNLLWDSVIPCYE